MNSIITLANHSLNVLQAKPKTCNFTHTHTQKKETLRNQNQESNNAGQIHFRGRAFWPYLVRVIGKPRHHLTSRISFGKTRNH